MYLRMEYTEHDSSERSCRAHRSNRNEVCSSRWACKRLDVYTNTYSLKLSVCVVCTYAQHINKHNHSHAHTYSRTHRFTHELTKSSNRTKEMRRRRIMKSIKNDEEKTEKYNMYKDKRHDEELNIKNIKKLNLFVVAVMSSMLSTKWCDDAA